MNEYSGTSIAISFAAVMFPPITTIFAMMLGGDSYIFHVAITLCTINAVLLILNRGKTLGSQCFSVNVMLWGLSAGAALLLFTPPELTITLKEQLGLMNQIGLSYMLTTGLIFYSQSFLLTSFGISHITQPNNYLNRDRNAP